MEIIHQYGAIFLIIAIVFGLFMTWGIGANDVANALGTSVGSGALNVKTAIAVAAIFEFLGALLAGQHVTRTIRKGIIDPGGIESTPEVLVYGMLAALLAAAIWLLIASIKGWPVSTTHSIVGAIVGFGIVGIGFDSVQWSKIGSIVASWVVSPVLGGAAAFVLMMSLQRLILDTPTPLRNAHKWAPVYLFLVGFVVSLVTLIKGLKHLKLELDFTGSLILSVLIGLAVLAVGKARIRRVGVDDTTDQVSQHERVEKIFAPMIIFTACAMAFAHGSNDVANGIGPLAAVYGLVQSGGEVAQKSAVPIWILVLGGAGIVLGLATYGYRVMQTIGRKITDLTPTRAFCATISAALTVILASRIGLPVSTTHIAVGAVIGVGLARGIAALNLAVVTRIIVSWITTLPVAGVLAAIIFFTLKGIFS
ncbi:MAG: anion permease [Rhodospirillales bacterium]|jgi:PiT family inorganic phosphate transporter|nr:anion permease [Rhodospirillales bacterium]